MTIGRRRFRGVLEGYTPGSAADRDPPRWSRNDPERPIGYDPERWAGLESGPGDGEGSGPRDGQQPLWADRESDRGDREPDRVNRESACIDQESARIDQESARRSAKRAERRAERPRKRRPERSPEERSARATERKIRAADVVAADPTTAAKAIVLRQLTMGARTRAQLRQAMTVKDIPEEVATAVLDRFEEVDLVDDKEFSRQWVQSRHLGRGLARRALAYELRQRGVAEDTVKDAVDEVTPDDELAAARELVRRKAATMRTDDPQRRMRRLAGMLARKGYGGGVAMQAIREELADMADLAELDSAEDEDPDLG